MEPWEDESSVKPTVLERRRQRERQRCLAHSLVGTFFKDTNFISLGFKIPRELYAYVQF